MRKYLADPAEAEAYVNVCLEDGNPWLIADAFRLVEQIHGKKLQFRVRTEAARRIRNTAPKNGHITRRAPAKRARRVAA
jgi:hypothetical protein